MYLCKNCRGQPLTTTLSGSKSIVEKLLKIEKIIADESISSENIKVQLKTVLDEKLEALEKTLVEKLNAIMSSQENIQTVCLA